MSSKASHYRLRSTLANQYTPKRKTLQMKVPEKNSFTATNTEHCLINSNDQSESNVVKTANINDTNDSRITTIDPHDTAIVNDLNVLHRRASPTVCDIAVSAMIFKVRRLQNNKDIDIICKFFNALGMENIPRSMKSIQEQIHRDFDMKHFCKCYYICSNCGASYLNQILACHSCTDGSSIFKFYLSSIKQQIEQLMLTVGFFTKLKEQKLENIHLFSNTKYGEILQEIQNNGFTMIINFDGISTCSKNLSLWPFVLIFNELPIPDRRYLEHVIVAGIISTAKKPTNSVVKTCLELIYEQLIQLEMGREFYIHDIDQRRILHFYTIASSTDKPAEALIENVASYNAKYGCPKCFATGELFHGERGNGSKLTTFTIRVYPFLDYRPRTQEECCKLVEELLIKINQTKNNNLGNNNKKKLISQKIKKISKKETSFGHFGACPLTQLKYFNYGTSFLTDSLHTIYAGAYKQLLRLLFDSEYRRHSWSLFNKIEEIDEVLSRVQIPSTTQRRFRSIKYIKKFKGSEFRCLFHFGTPAIIKFTENNLLKNLILSFVTAINLASADYITYEDTENVKKLLIYFVQHFQNIFGLRHMSSNIHSLLHIHESLRFIGPLWFYSTFSFEGIDKDLISTVHGTTEFAKQLLRQHVLYRDAIIKHKNEHFPLVLFNFNEDLLDRKQCKIKYKYYVDSCSLPNTVSKEFYDTSENGIATNVQSFFNGDISFFNSLVISGVLVKTITMTHGKLVNDCCVSFQFGDDQIKYGLIRAIVKSKQDSVRLYIEELIEKKPESSRYKFKINDEQFEVPNIFQLKRSNIFHLKHPKWILKKNAIICQPGNCVTVLEYPNLKDSS